MDEFKLCFVSICNVSFVLFAGGIHCTHCDGLQVYTAAGKCHHIPGKPMPTCNHSRPGQLVVSFSNNLLNLWPACEVYFLQIFKKNSA